MTSPFDKMSERLTRNLARFSSRRGFLSKLGVALLAAPAFPLLPVARTARAAEPKGAAPKTDFERNAQTTDDTKCNYWKYCGSDGVLCSCCGGGHHTCPPGAEPSPISWIGTCVNPQDGKSFVIAQPTIQGAKIIASKASPIMIATARFSAELAICHADLSSRSPII